MEKENKNGPMFNTLLYLALDDPHKIAQVF